MMKITMAIAAAAIALVGTAPAAAQYHDRHGYHHVYHDRGYHSGGSYRHYVRHRDVYYGHGYRHDHGYRHRRYGR